MFARFLESLRNPSPQSEERQTVLTLKPTPEEIAQKEAARQKRNKEYRAKREQVEKEALDKRIQFLKQIDAVVRPMLQEINSQQLNNLGKITVRPEITEVRAAKDWVDSMVHEHFIKKQLTHYALEWRTKETGLNGFCITIRIMDEDLEQQNPLITLNTDNFFIGYLVADFKKKNWAEKLKKSVMRAIEWGETSGWDGVPEERGKAKTDPIPTLGYEPIEDVEGPALEEHYPFPEGCKKCGRPFGAKLLKEAYHTHESVIECPGCGTPVHRRKQ